MDTAFVFALVCCSIQTMHFAVAKPLVPGGCICEGLEGGYPLEREFGRREFSCGPISPPMSFLPVPQPVPVRVPQLPQRQSVTFPNIILALLPPNQKPPLAPKPVVRPPPVVLPLPQHYPMSTAEKCSCC